MRRFTIPASFVTPTLQVDAYTLRPLHPDDAPAVHRLVNDWSVVRMLSQLPFPYPRELAESWIAGTCRQSRADEAWHFAIVEDDALAGCVGVVLDRVRRQARIGYWVGRPFWGKGMASTCVRRIAAWALATLPVDRIVADVAEDNVASIAVLRRTGFVETGVSQKAFVSRGGEHPVRLFEATREAIAPEAAPPSTTRRTLLVVAAALIDAEQRILLARRPEGKTLAGLWEFPGGKVEPHESPEQALIRELQEELGIDISQGCITPFTFVSEDVGRFHLLMPLYLCRRWRHTPTPREGQTLAWVAARDLGQYPMPEPDRPLIPLLQELL